MEEWKEYKALEFCYNVTDGTHDSPKPKEEGYYLITSKHLKDNGIDFASAKKISETDYLKVIQRSKVEQYDILYSMIGRWRKIPRQDLPTPGRWVSRARPSRFRSFGMRRRGVIGW